MSSFQLFLFGAPRLERDGELVFINRRRAMALLAYLAVTGQSHSRDVLATLFWPERDQSNARANLRRDLSRLKQALDDEVLLIDRLHAGVNPEAELWLDVAAFQGNVVKAQQHGHPPQALCTDCYTALIEAVVLYSDDFMAGFSLPDSPEFDDWQFFQAESLRRSLAGALEQLIHWCIKQGEYEQGIEHGRRWLALDSLHEPAHRQLMQLYAWSGQQAAAIRQYQECVRLLDEELGVEPEEETLLLYQTIKARQLAPPEPSAVPPSPLLGATPAPPPHERYLQQELLMASGQGEVYLGLDRVANQPVVIKRLRSDLVARRPELVARLVREGEALSQLNHPNIVRMLAVLERDEDYAIVMEYVVGGSLRQLLDEVSQLPLERALDIALELADALSRAHHLNIIHRDLKPDNVLLAADGTPRLTDFGMARLGGDEARLTQTGSFIGSPAYMSPEALHGEELDARSDIWSFGVLLYEMLAGRRPFAGTHITSVLVSILNDPLPELQHFRPDVPPPLINLLQRMLIKERQERIASMRQVAAELEAIRAGKGDIEPGEPERRISKIVSSPRIRSFTPVHRHTPTSTPLPATPFIGREQELADITNTLANADTRLLTLVGPGGIGKTRLALAAADQVISAFSDGVYFVPLAPLESAGHIASALADSLDYQFRGSREPKEQLLDYLHHRRLLLVLDNFEHLLEGAGLVAEILAHAPGLKVLTTSRERLNLSGEMLFTLGGMPYPDWQRATDTDATAYGAVQLLLQRVRLLRPDLAEERDLVHAARICQLVEGMPLALVLAAGWLELLSLEEIAAEIAQSLDFLETEMRDVPERQRSMRAVFASSWARLTEEEQQVFRKLTVFRGGFTRQAAHAVAGATLHSLRALLNKSFITVDQDGRYGMHELLRQFGTEKLLASAEAETTVDAHCAFYLSSLRQREADLKGGRQLPALREISLDIDNVRMAWWHAIERQDVRALEQSAACLWLYSDMRGALHEGEAAFRQATAAFSDVVDVDSEVTVPDERVSLLGFLIAGQGMMRAQRGELEAGRTMMEKGIALLRRFVADDRHKYRVAFSLVWLGWVVFLQAKNDEAERLIQESLALFTDIGDRWGIAKSLFALGNNYTAIGQLKASEKPLRDCLTICKEIDDRRGLLLANRNLSILTYWFGDYAQTKQLLDEADALSREFDDQVGLAYALRELGKLEIAQGNYRRAIDTLHESIRITNEIGSNWESAATMADLGIALRIQGDRDAAEQAFNTCLQAATAIDNRYYIARCLGELGVLADGRGQAQQAEQLLHRALTLWQQVGHEPYSAWVLMQLADIIGAHELRGSESRHCYVRALQLALKNGLRPLMMDLFTSIAGFLMLVDKAQFAAALLALAECHPASTWETMEKARLRLSRLSASMSTPDAQTARTRGQALDWREAAALLVTQLAGLSEADFAAAWERGKVLDLDKAVADFLAQELPKSLIAQDPAEAEAAASRQALEQEIRFCMTPGGASIAYATVGEGPPLVKAANWLSHLEFDWQSPVWRHWLRALALHHSLIRYDERGCGLSDWDIDDFSFEAWLRDLEAVVDATGLERFPLLGVSQGGPIAIAYAVRHPEKVSHLILYGSYARGRLHRNLTKQQMEETKMLIDLVRLGWGQEHPAFRQVFTTLFIPEGTPEQLQWFNDLQRISTSPENAARIISGFDEIDVRALARQVAVPTLVLHSRGELRIPFEEGRLLASLIPGARFVPLESKNHILLENEPAWQRFLAELYRFLR